VLGLCVDSGPWGGSGVRLLLRVLALECIRPTWAATTMTEKTDSMSDVVIPCSGRRTISMSPSSGLLTNGQMAAHRTVERIEAQFGLAKHHARDAKRAFIATSLWNSWTAFSTGATFPSATLFRAVRSFSPAAISVYRLTGLF